MLWTIFEHPWKPFGKNDNKKCNVLLTLCQPSRHWLGSHRCTAGGGVENKTLIVRTLSVLRAMRGYARSYYPLDYFTAPFPYLDPTNPIATPALRSPLSLQFTQIDDRECNGCVSIGIQAGHCGGCTKSPFRHAASGTPGPPVSQ